MLIGLPFIDNVVYLLTSANAYVPGQSSNNFGMSLHFIFQIYVNSSDKIKLNTWYKNLDCLIHPSYVSYFDFCDSHCCNTYFQAYP